MTCREGRREIEKRYRDKNREKVRAWGRAWYAANIDHARAQVRESKARHPETKAACNRRWAAANADKLAESRAKWKASNQETIRAAAHRRRAQKRLAEGHHTPSDLIRIRGQQKDRCACCRVKLSGRGSLDHIQSLARGGSNWPSNLQFLCDSCNASKNARDPIDFMRSRGRLL